MRTLDILVGRLLCRLERHDWVLVSRRKGRAVTIPATLRRDECARCGATRDQVDELNRGVAIDGDPQHH